ncbi:hypothetical protein B0H17DRAFT_1136496 [Mycena rosella]|uniref:Uncharacterized protein n=1 Tax=Mycena rosella TaxID=1033263 RepID=A0AAD7DAS5_MYCRO|nr:hypothetical protein B0H17DRAFT_1136496 [Mycena rosella]
MPTRKTPGGGNNRKGPGIKAARRKIQTVQELVRYEYDQPAQKLREAARNPRASGAEHIQRSDQVKGTRAETPTRGGVTRRIRKERLSETFCKTKTPKPRTRWDLDAELVGESKRTELGECERKYIQDSLNVIQCRAEAPELSPTRGVRNCEPALGDRKRSFPSPGCRKSDGVKRHHCLQMGLLSELYEFGLHLEPSIRRSKEKEGEGSTGGNIDSAGDFAKDWAYNEFQGAPSSARGPSEEDKLLCEAMTRGSNRMRSNRTKRSEAEGKGLWTDTMCEATRG